MRNMAMISTVLVLLGVLACGCPDNQPQTTGKVVISGNLFGDGSDLAKSLGQAGMAHLKWLMAGKVDHVSLWLGRSIDCQIDGDGTFHAEVDRVPLDDYKVALYAVNEGQILGDLFHAEQTFTVKPGNNVLNITPVTFDEYYIDIVIQNTPGVYGKPGPRPCELEDDAGNLMDFNASVWDSGSVGIISFITARIPIDLVVRKIHLFDDNGKETVIERNLSLIDKMMSTASDGQIRIDCGQRGDVAINVDLGLKEPPSLDITSNDDGTVTIVLSAGDFQLNEDGTWSPKMEKVPSCQIQKGLGLLDGYNWPWPYVKVEFDQPLVVSRPLSINLFWSHVCEESSLPPDATDILVTLDGVPIGADSDGWWHLQ